jgi:mono/diheme cytochrome c family protein
MTAVRNLLLLTALTVALTCTQSAFAQDDKAARGKYLVEEVAKCQDCHTPKMQDGTPMKTATLRGTTLNFAAAVPIPGWRTLSPDITPQGALWKRWGEDGILKFLQTGKGPRGNKPGPPMPAYNLKPDDAEAIVAYLKTLQ